MRLQALLITERVLGCLHKDTIFRLLPFNCKKSINKAFLSQVHVCRGGSCWYEWVQGMHQALELCTQSEDYEGDPPVQWYLLHCEGSHPAVHEHSSEGAKQGGDTVWGCSYYYKVSICQWPTSTFWFISCRHINRGLEQSISLLELQPRYKTQEENFDLVLQCWLHLCYLLVTLGSTYQVASYLPTPTEN